MKNDTTRWVLMATAVTALVGALVTSGCEGEVVKAGPIGYTEAGMPIYNEAGASPNCPNGSDDDKDGYGNGCPAGLDCDDKDPEVYVGAKELCDGKDNDCDGQVDEGLSSTCITGAGTSKAPPSANPGKDKPFPIDPSKDPNVKEANGVKLDENGDLIIGSSQANFRYMWIANTYDMAGSSVCQSSKTGETEACRGTVSKVDTKNMKEVARYFSVTCRSKAGSTSCVDVNGLAINKSHNHTPSRTAVDFNMDAWVANRNVHGGQPVATKFANDKLDCIDRNKNNKIDTSSDKDGDGKITIDCDGDKLPDSASTKCSGSLAGKGPEFLGDDDECILFSVNYGEKDDVGRSLCLDSGKSTVGASDAWVGTFYRPENGRGTNRFYKINGYTGKIEATIDIVKGHHTYGCMADANHIIWSTDIGTEDNGKKWNGSLTYFQTISPYQVGKLLRGPTASNYWKDKNGEYHHYGISINADQHVWLGGWQSSWVLRYKPDRTSFATLGNGKWTRVDIPNGWYTRGVAADNRGKVWVGIHQGGYVLRLDQNLPDGVINKKNLQLNQGYWAVSAKTVIGVGVDFDGNVWGVGHSNDMASRLDVDSKGNVTNNSSGTKNNVSLGRNPYSYSDFTGFGLTNFVRPQGRWSYLHSACSGNQKAQWKKVKWSATTPAGTAVSLRVRSGDSETTFGSWSQVYTASPADIGPTSSSPIKPNPSKMLQVEFTLTTKSKQLTPILHDYGVEYLCITNPG